MRKPEDAFTVRMALMTEDDLHEIVLRAMQVALADLKRERDEEQWLTAQQAADFLQVHRRTLARLVDRGLIYGSHAGRDLRIKKADLLAYLERER